MSQGAGGARKQGAALAQKRRQEPGLHPLTQAYAAWEGGIRVGRTQGMGELTQCKVPRSRALAAGTRERPRGAKGCVSIAGRGCAAKLKPGETQPYAGGGCWVLGKARGGGESQQHAARKEAVPPACRAQARPARLPRSGGARGPASARAIASERKG